MIREKASGGRCDALDGLRAVSVGAVLAVHAGVPGFESGWLGVDVFFVLSGFLITSLLLAEFSRSGVINLRRFYARRILRLMPAYWLYASLLTAMMVFGYGKLTSHGGFTPATYVASLWLYFINYVPAGGIWEHQWLSLHLWSLAVEEQFYIVWPLLLLLVLKMPRPRLAIALFTLLHAFYFFFLSSDWNATHALPGRGVSITIGCWFAALPPPSRQRRCV